MSMLSLLFYRRFSTGMKKRSGITELKGVISMMKLFGTYEGRKAQNLSRFHSSLFYVFYLIIILFDLHIVF